jgi:5-methyltetrahydrofolate--homocysteine methyltransferase
MADIFVAISEAIQMGDRDKVAKLAEEALKKGTPALDILYKGMVPGIESMGEKFKSGEFFLPEILICARAMNRGTEVLNPYFPKEGVHKRGTVVIGTIEGDMHDIGKNLVRMMLECSGFRMVDLGVDVSADSFAEAAREQKADIIAISALLTTTMVNIPKVIEALKRSGIRDNVKVMIGGAPVTRAYADQIGAEGFAEDCTAAVDEAKRLVAA